MLSPAEDRRIEFMREAIRLAGESMASGGGPFGAVVVRQGSVIGRGQNRVTVVNDPTAHAEIMAIRQACETLGHFRLGGCELFTSCEPCPMCLGAALWSRLDRVWYGADRADAKAIGFDDSEFYEELSKKNDDRRAPLTSLLRHEAQQVFRAWEQLEGKTPY